MAEHEQRTIDVDVTDIDTRGKTVHGFAAVYGAEARIGDITETIAKGAFAGVLDHDVRALLNHDPNVVLGRTKSGTLRLFDDVKGLRFEVDLPESRSDLREAISRGDLDGASFRFVVADEQWDGDRRTITRVGELHDICLATYPAYPATSVELRTRSNNNAAEERQEDKMEPEDRQQAQQETATGGLQVEDRIAVKETRTLSQAYKPSAIRSYEASLRLRVVPEFGAVRLTEIRRTDLQDFADGMLTEGLDPSTIQTTMMPLRAIYRRAVARGEMAVNPTTGLELPAVRAKRDRIASPEEAAHLIAALLPDDRALWATAMYGGLRRGELMALRWENVDLAKGVIRVDWGWDMLEGVIELKSRKGRRTVPIAAVLRDHLVEHRMSGHDGLAFGRTPTSPFSPNSVSARAATAWAKVKPITLHEARHTFASLMIAAGVNAKALSTYMGHANIAITLDRYGHLMPGNEEEAAGLLDAYLERADTKARLAQLD